MSVLTVFVFVDAPLATVVARLHSMPLSLSAQAMNRFGFEEVSGQTFEMNSTFTGIIDVEGPHIPNFVLKPFTTRSNCSARIQELRRRLHVERTTVKHALHPYYNGNPIL